MMATDMNQGAALGWRAETVWRVLAGWMVLALSLPVVAWQLDVSGVEDELADNLQATLRPVLESDSKVSSELRQHMLEASREAMQAEGYYRAQFTLEEVREGSRIWRLHVEPGDPVTIRSFHLDIKGAANKDEAFRPWRASITLHEGDIFHHGKYEALKSSLQALAVERGYFDGGWTRHRVQIDTVANVADLDLVYDSGDRYKLGVVEYQSQPVAKKLLDKLVPFKPGTDYEAALILRFNKNLIDSHYFRSVQVHADHEKAIEHVIPVQVELQPGKPNTMDIGLGYATDVGPRVSLKWSRPLLTHSGHSMAVTGEFSAVQSRIEATYSIPLSHPSEDTFQILYGFQKQTIQQTVTDKTVLGVQHVLKSEDNWQELRFLRWNREDFSRSNGETGRSDLLLPGLSWSRTRSLGGIDPWWGDRQYYEIEGGGSRFGSDANIVETRAGWRLLRTPGGKNRLFFRVDGGAALTNNWDKIPPTLRFFAGGDQSIRGYSYQSLGPTDAFGNVLGGHYLAVGSAEYGYQWRPRWRTHVFYDVGNAYDSLRDPSRRSIGVGTAWLSPVGPIRLDIAWGLQDPDHPVRLHFSMGPVL